MKVAFKFNHWIPRALNVNAITLYPYILFTEPRERVSDTIIRHEMIHVRQARELGCLKFYFSYVAEYLRHRLRGWNHDAAYRQISFEKEAYEHQSRMALTDGELKEIEQYLS